MASTTNFSVRVDSNVKKQCEALYGMLGVNLTTAINVFLRQSLRTGGFPFQVTLGTYGSALAEAIAEADELCENPDAQGFDDVEEALRELKL